MEKKSSFVYGILAGLLITGFFELIIYFYLGVEYWNNPKTYFGYHLHHSLFGLLSGVLGAILYQKRKSTGLFLIGLGIGIIILHTITDGRLIFLEKL